MNQRVCEVAPYGSWPSPVTAASLTADTVALSEPRMDGADVFWLEGRPSDGGRVVVVRRTSDGRTHDVVGAPFNVRSRVHEYGGGAYDVADGVLVFSNFDDRRVYRVDLNASGAGGDPRPITPSGDLRFGDLRIGSSGGWILAVCEDHGGGAAEPTNRLVRLDITGDNADGGVVLVDGHDFVYSGVLSRDGARLAWLQWDHPNMPWDGTELCVADIDGDGRLSSSQVVAGGRAESVCQPTWAPDGRLVFISDRTGWWNLYACDVSAGEDADEPAEPVALWTAEHEFADPSWVFGMSSYGISVSGVLLGSWLVDGYARLGTLDLESGDRVDLESDATAVFAVRVDGTCALLLLGHGDRPMTLERLDLFDPASSEVLREAAPRRLEPAFVSIPDAVTWLTPDGEEVHGFYSAPQNPGFVGVAGELPP